MKNLDVTVVILLLFMAAYSSDDLTAQSQLCASNDPSSPVGIVPTLENFPGGNPQCGNLRSYRINSPAEGVTTINLDGFGTTTDITIIITNEACGKVVAWSAEPHIIIDEIVCKGGNKQNVYDYSGIVPRPASDGKLHCPLTSSNKYADFSHIDFCFHYRLTASKTANAEFTRTYVWDIDKGCDGNSQLTLSVGQVYNYPFSWIVSETHYDSDFKVTGTADIENNTPLSATITNISDVLSGGETGVLNCGVSFPYVLAPGATLNCTYSANLTAPYDGTNTITVTTNTANIEGDVATANFVFGDDPTYEIDECIEVSDDCTSTTEVCADVAPYSATYTCPISYSECGTYTYVNTASFTTNDTETTGSDNCSVSVNVPCNNGCTLTIGYWKTHSIYGPAPYDDTWAMVGEDSPFFLSGKSWYEAAWTPPAGNAYYILAHQYIAVKLNFLNGASMPAAVQTAFNTSTNLFNTYTPAKIGALNGNNPIRKQFIALAKILDDYNNGITGPGHCSEESSNGNKPAENRAAVAIPNGDFSVYPNPTRHTVQVDLSNFKEQAVELVMNNQLGEVILDHHIGHVSESIVTLHFDQGLPSGIYYLSLVCTNRRLTRTILVNK